MAVALPPRPGQAAGKPRDDEDRIRQELWYWGSGGGDGMLQPIDASSMACACGLSYATHEELASLCVRGQVQPVMDALQKPELAKFASQPLDAAGRSQW
eukprot:Skav234696  [mRNA]  locus=scaffold3643:183781:184474:- [translate_table: standard]